MAAVTFDHLDLLVSAGLVYGVAADPLSSAFAPTRRVVARSAEEIGRHLWQQAATRRPTPRESRHITSTRTPRHEFRNDLEPGPAGYRFTGVPEEQIVPVEVLKACQAFEHVCAESLAWSSSWARRYVTALAAAATQHLPGFSEAPWSWSRPVVRDLLPVGFGGQWRPPLAGLCWVGADQLVTQLVTQWARASIILVTTEVLPAAAAEARHLLPRPGIILLAGDSVPDWAWPAARTAGVENVAFYPAAIDWLNDQLTTPGKTSAGKTSAGKTAAGKTAAGKTAAGKTAAGKMRALNVERDH